MHGDQNAEGAPPISLSIKNENNSNATLRRNIMLHVNDPSPVPTMQLISLGSTRDSTRIIFNNATCAGRMCRTSRSRVSCRMSARQQRVRKRPF